MTWVSTRINSINMSKLPIPTGPSGIARQFMLGSSPKNNPEKGGDREPSAKVAGRPPRVIPTQETRLRQQHAEAVLLHAETDAQLSKAQKVKAWRLANPEAYAKQKREFAEKRAAKKRAEKEGANE